MSSNNRTRSDRVASLHLPPGQAARIWSSLGQSAVLARLAICIFAATLMWLSTGAWSPPFAFRRGQIPQRTVTARVEFSRTDEAKTTFLQAQKLRETLCVYLNEPKSLVELRHTLRDQLFQVTRAMSFNNVDSKVVAAFVPKTDEGNALRSHEEVYLALREALQDDKQLTVLDNGLTEAMQPLEQRGLLETLKHAPEKGSHQELLVVGADNGDESEESRSRLLASQVRIAEVVPTLEPKFKEAFEKHAVPPAHAEVLAQSVVAWMNTLGLPETLTLDVDATQKEYQKAIEEVGIATMNFRVGDPIAQAGVPLSSEQIDILRTEHDRVTAESSRTQLLAFGAAKFGMFVALFTLCGVYMFFHRRALIVDTFRLSSLLFLIVITLALGFVAARDGWWAEVIPLLLFGMIVSVAYDREVSLLLSAVVSLVISFSLGQGLAEFVTLVAASSTAILLMNRIRSRTKLIYVGIFAGLVAFLTTLGVGTLVGQTFGASNFEAIFPSTGAWADWPLLERALILGFYSTLAGFLMTGILPFVERAFDVQTDLSLLELSDAAHPLLQELARRAPGTYNHSINVASIAEAAAKSIGADALLVRVGAYFHDIGKMLKPEYFVENQEPGDNCHESLLPAMSTLVIIAHVKDGADLARKHHLPQSIIDFIEQHHGTTLVEYFYLLAKKDDLQEVDESSFRYPGPKPQSVEAGIMMLADAVESACRTLVDPTSARIESLVHEIVMKKLMDGQFDECGLTLKQISATEKSLVKSLTAVYHGRIKYADTPESSEALAQTQPPTQPIA